MIDLECVTKENEIVRNKLLRAVSPSMRKDLAYDLFEIEGLATMLSGEDILYTPSLHEFFDYVSDSDGRITGIFLDDLLENFEFYQTQAHNVLTRFGDYKFDLHSRKDTGTYETLEDSFDILRAFLSSYDEKVYKLFMEMYEGRIGTSPLFDEVSDFGIEGKCFFVNSLRKSYILGKYDYDNVNSLSLLVHELGHAYEFKLLTDKNFEQRQGIYATNLAEVSSTFLENAFIEFLLENNIHPEETTILKHRFLKLIFEQFLQAHIAMNSSAITLESYFVDVPRRECTKIMRQVKREYGFDVNIYNLEFNINSLLTYGNSMLVALALYKPYKEDPTSFKKDFENILMNYGMAKDNGIYRSLGVSDKSVCEATMLVPELKKDKKRMQLILKK